MADAKFKLDDILNKQKAPPQILDLVNLDIQTEEEYQAIIEKIPDYKIRPEKPQDVQHTLALEKEMINDANLLFSDESRRSVGKKTIPENAVSFRGPLPKTKTDEEIFSRLVQLDKWRLQTRAREQEQDLARGGKNPFIVVKQPSSSKGGVTETSIKVCSECAEEFCSGTCKEFQYDAYQRIIIPEKEAEVGSSGKTSKKKKSSHKKKRSKTRPTTLKPTKSH
ncbi:unnamed protein product [Lepeophtheirus salmonis]|uniref:(salmon louse) hypothetical protein n=1 Tax=Lepeophtheirus salmonis TaxID=72036 RepID=A0A7R8CV25_LEPSM|nr:unnamed protein product [Lepeophtheirus salmonis]CAF2941548.1 unnamed protein product [Lepeophtheirus salmonis]